MKSSHDELRMQHFSFSRKALSQERAFTARPRRILPYYGALNSPVFLLLHASLYKSLSWASCLALSPEVPNPFLCGSASPSIWGTIQVGARAELWIHPSVIYPASTCQNLPGHGAEPCFCDNAWLLVPVFFLASSRRNAKVQIRIHCSLFYHQTKQGKENNSE